MAKSRVTDRDRGYRQMMANLDKQRDLKITVGVHEDDGAQPDGDQEGAPTVAEVAEANEFGLGVPERPAITGWADENESRVISEARTEYEKALKAGVSPAQRCDALAQTYAGEVQARIAAGVPPPNSPVTIAIKGSDTPLIDTGTFRSSIAGRVGEP